MIRVRSVEDASRKWGSLFEGPGWVTPVLALDSGARIRLVRADAEGIQSIVVKVKAPKRAEQFLEKQKMLDGAEAGRLRIAPAAVGGLSVMLVED